MNPQSKDLSAPDFTKRQLDWLEKMFPEYPATAATPDDTLRFSAGQRSVLRVVKERVKPEQGQL